MSTLREVAAFECDVSGHSWAVERYVDTLDRSGRVVMAAYAVMRCWRCKARTEVPNAAE